MQIHEPATYVLVVAYVSYALPSRSWFAPFKTQLLTGVSGLNITLSQTRNYTSTDGFHSPCRGAEPRTPQVGRKR